MNQQRERYESFFRSMKAEIMELRALKASVDTHIKSSKQEAPSFLKATTIDE
jgi:hypothetical protein